MDRKQELMYYYWFKASEIDFDTLLEIEFNAFNDALICEWKLFKAHKFLTIEGEKEVIIISKN